MVHHVSDADEVDVVRGHPHSEITLRNSKDEVLTFFTANGANFQGLNECSPVVRVNNSVANAKSHGVKPLSESLGYHVTTRLNSCRYPPLVTTTRLNLTPRRSALLIGACALAAAPLLAGCFNGPDATTTTQSSMNSGNGTQQIVGDLRIENATLITGPEGSASGTLITTLVNTGREHDHLVGLTINGVPAYITPGAGELAPSAAVNFGYDSDFWLNTYDLIIASSAFVPVTMQFERAGTTSFSVLSVPAVGSYEGIAPNPASAPR